MTLGNLVEKYGLPGIVIAGLAWFVLYLMKEHKKERKEWRESQERLQDDTNRNIRENTNVLAGLKTLLENRK